MSNDYTNELNELAATVASVDDGFACSDDQSPIQIVDRDIKMPNDCAYAVCCDANSQLLTFQLPRFVEGVDLTSRIASIKFKNANGESDRATPYSVSETDEVITLVWRLDNNVTVKDGTVTFQIEFYETVDGKLYSWQTKTATFNVLPTLDIDGNIEASLPTWVQETTAKLNDTVNKLNNLTETFGEYVIINYPGKDSAGTASNSRKADCTGVNSFTLTRSGIMKADSSLMSGEQNKVSNDAYASLTSGLNNNVSGASGVVGGKNNTNEGTSCNIVGEEIYNSGHHSAIFGTHHYNIGTKVLISGTGINNVGNCCVLVGENLDNSEKHAYISPSNVLMFGRGLKSGGRGQHILGDYNKVEDNFIVFIIGNGSDAENRSNLFTLDKEGNIITPLVNMKSLLKRFSTIEEDFISLGQKALAANSLSHFFANNYNNGIFGTVETFGALFADYIFKQNSMTEITVDLSNCYSMVGGFLNSEVETVTFENGTPKLTKAQSLFRDCINLVSVNGLDLTNADEIKYLYMDCASLTDEINIDSKATDISYILYNCKAVTTVSINAQNITNATGAFTGCTSITSLVLNGMTASFDVSDTAIEDFTELFNSLGVASADATITVGTKVIADDIKAIVTEKRWTIA